MSCNKEEADRKSNAVSVFFLVACQWWYKISPFVNRGSGSFRKKDFSKLLMTFRSRHFCREVRDCWSITLKQSSQHKSVTVKRCCQRSGTLYCAAKLSVTHVFLDVDVIHAFTVELLLHAGDGSVVPRDSVDSCVLQTSLLHHITANFHDQRNKLHNTQPAGRCYMWPITDCGESKLWHYNGRNSHNLNTQPASWYSFL